MANAMEQQQPLEDEVEESLFGSGGGDVDESQDSNVNELVATAQVEIVEIIDADVAPVPPPPPVVVQEPVAQGINYSLCRTELHNFFVMRVQDRSKSMNWSLRDTFPRRGKDTELDKKLEDLGLSDNRRYASQKWLDFRKARGVKPLPGFECHGDEVVKFVTPTVSTLIVSEAMKKIAQQFNGPMYAECLAIAQRTDVQKYLNKEVLFFAQLVDDTLKGAKPATIDGRVNSLLRIVKKDRRMELIGLVLKLLPSDTSASVMRVYFGELHQTLYDEFQTRVAESVTPKMETDVSDQVICHRLSASLDILAYTAGWFINRTLRMVLSGVDKSTLFKFVSFNTVKKAAYTRAASFPSRAIDERENKTDALKRPGAAWFQFVCLLEALFLVNMNALQVLHHRGRVLQMISVTARKSDALRQKFRQCIPPDFTSSETKQMWRLYYLVLVPTYGALKSSDVLRKVRESRPASVLDKMPIRTYSAAAHERAKKGDKNK
jgi:hypothetical protein